MVLLHMISSFQGQLVFFYETGERPRNNNYDTIIKNGIHIFDEQSTL